MTTKYEIQLEGVHARDLSFSVLRDLAELVVEGASRAARLAAEGRSTGRGGAPAWLGEAGDVRLVGLREGSLVLDVTARPLAEIASGVFPTGTMRTPRGELPGEQLALPAQELGPYFGQWPGDEDDEQVFAALREVS